MMAPQRRVAGMVTILINERPESVYEEIEVPILDTHVSRFSKRHRGVVVTRVTLIPNPQK